MAVLKSVLTPNPCWNPAPLDTTILPGEARVAKTARIEAAYRGEEAEHDAINARVTAEWGSLSRPEPKSIHSPAPRPKHERIPPRKPSKASTSGQKPDIKGEIGSFRLPEKRHPGFPPQLKPYLNRHYGEE